MDERCDTSVNAGGTPALPGADNPWRSRGYLPHFDLPGLVQMVTFRLADAMPAERRREWERMLETDDRVKRHARIEAYLDAGYGACHLKDVRVSRLVEDALMHFDGDRYRLLSWVVMPNHVHALIELSAGHRLDRVIHSWKSFTAKRANALLSRGGPFWQREYFDRFIRDSGHFEAAVSYIHENPVKARLVDRAQDWPSSSAQFCTPGSAGVSPATDGSEG